MSPLRLDSTAPTTNPFHEIPRLGFGVYTSNGPTCIKSCLTALRAGYRHIDSAQEYHNEHEVGQAVLQSGIPRDQLFLTTKIADPRPTPEDTYASIVESVREMSGGVEGGYVDLFLVHDGDIGKYEVKKLWVALEQAQREGLCRCIGISNAGITQIEVMKEYATVWPPQVNQIEREIAAYCKEHSILLEAYAPLVKNQRSDDAVLKQIAQKCNKSTAQVLIRYSLQKGWIPLPKSDTPSRIEGNADVYDFELTEQDMGELDACDQGREGAVYEAVSNERGEQ